MNYQKLPIEKVKLDFENPRIKQYVEMYGDNVTSEAIALALTSSNKSDASSTYSALKDSIKVNKGIIMPIIVNHLDNDDYVVIEGNTRLQIYKEFAENDPSGPWKEIIAIVHENLPSDEIHAIRLQAHLVGPRDWDAFSKAKYLNQLLNIDLMPLNQVISYCGGKKAEIEKLVSAYKDMTKYYFKIAEKEGMYPDPKEFSKFAELQNRSILDSLVATNNTKEDFAKWVVNGNIDTAQNVRKLPSILKNEKATEVFLKSNISEAIKFIDADDKTAKALLSSTLYDLSYATTLKIRNLPYEEFKLLKTDTKFDDKKNILRDLYDELGTFLGELED